MALYMFLRTTSNASRALLSSVSIVRCFGVKKFQWKTLTSSSYGKRISVTGKNTEEKNPPDAARGEELRRIHVGNLLKGKDDYTSEDKVFEYFSQYGKIELLEFFRHKFTKLPRGFAFVTFQNAESAHKVLSQTESHRIDGHKVIVEVPLGSKAQHSVEKRNMSVLVDNILRETSKEEIEEHFSRFGRVERAIFAKEDLGDENKRSYYVIFSEVSGAKKALEQPIQKIGDQDIDSQVTDLPRGAVWASRKYTQKMNCVSITSIPGRLTVEDLRDYFQQYGDVETVDFVVNGGIASCNPQEDANVAFVRFSDVVSVTEIVQNANHIIAGSNVQVSSYRDTVYITSAELRELKVSVEGLPLSTKPKAIEQYFEKTFGIVPNGVFLNKHQELIHNKLVCIIRLSNTLEVERVLGQRNGTFHGHPVYFRRLFWKKSEQ